MQIEGLCRLSIHDGNEEGPAVLCGAVLCASGEQLLGTSWWSVRCFYCIRSSDVVPVAAN